MGRSTVRDTRRRGILGHARRVTLAGFPAPARGRRASENADILLNLNPDIACADYMERVELTFRHGSR